jgi:hypothetical protein
MAQTTRTFKLSPLRGDTASPQRFEHPFVGFDLNAEFASGTTTDVEQGTRMIVPPSGEQDQPIEDSLRTRLSRR